MNKYDYDGIPTNRPKRYHDGKPYIYENLREEIQEAMKYNAPILLNNKGNTTHLLFIGFLVILNPDGTYKVEDTTGG